MYKSNWDTEKLSHSYKASKYQHEHKEGEKEKYHDAKYGADEPGKSDYMRLDQQKKKEDEKKDDFFNQLEDDKKKEQKEEDIQFKAAKQIFNEHKDEPAKAQKKKEVNSIEEAIKKAVEDEKKVIILDK